MTDRKLVPVLLLMLLTAASGHHILGIPHYSYDEDYPQTPILTYRLMAGAYEVRMTGYPGVPVPGERCDLHVYIQDPDSGRLFVTSSRVALDISGQETPSRRCSTSQDVSWIFLGSSRLLSIAAALPEMKYSPPARGEETTWVPSRPSGSAISAAVPQIRHFPSLLMDRSLTVKPLFPYTPNTFITSSPKWFMTLTAKRPVEGRGNGREESR